MTGKSHGHKSLVDTFHGVTKQSDMTVIKQFLG